MKISDFAERLSQQAGIVNLMDDLGEALAVNPEILFLGGGNPAQIPEVSDLLQHYFKKISANTESIQQYVGTYSAPQGHAEILQVVAAYLREQCKWQIKPENVALVNGSQLAQFILLNMFAGKVGSEHRKVWLPLVPEYLGYASQGLAPDMFLPSVPNVSAIDEHFFKYQIDFDGSANIEKIGAICLSRPTNPSGNVVSLDELDTLSSIAKERNIPLIIDSAYGLPFPGLIYDKQPAYWNDDSIVVLSTSKLGLPGLRCAIVVAKEEIVQKFVQINAVINLSNANIGQFMIKELILSHKIDALCSDIIPRFYLQKRDFCVALIQARLAGLPYRIHVAQGAFFLWLWLEGLPITSRELYSRLKKRNVLVVDGSHFFFGLEKSWKHANECVRISYCQQSSVLERGIEIISEELKKLY